MSSSQRSSSGVRNLRAVFENADSSDSLSPLRGRSPSGSICGSSNTDKSPASSTTRRVRSSFVPVEPSGHLLVENSDLSNRIRPKMSSAERRDIAHLDRDNTTQTSNGVGVIPAVPTPTGATSETPAAPVKNELVSPESQNSAMSTGVEQQPVTLPTKETQSEHLDKKVSAVEDEEAVLLPTDMTEEKTVSSDVGLLNRKGEDDETPEHSKPPNYSKHSEAVSAATATASKSRPSLGTKPAIPPKGVGSFKKPSTAAVKSPTQKSPPAAKPPPKSPTRPVRLSSHLTQPTASSSAKHESQTTVTTKPRSSSASQRAIEVSSHIMAPTAASKAKRDPEPSNFSTKTASTRPRASILPKRDRTSLANSSNSAVSQKPPTKSNRTSLAPSTNETVPKHPGTKPPSEGFLARMMKPTSASSSKSHEKIDVKSPPRPLAAPGKPSNVASKSAQSTYRKSATAPPAKPVKGKENATKSPVMSKPAKLSPIQLTPIVNPERADDSTPAEHVSTAEAEIIEAASFPDKIHPLVEDVRAPKTADPVDSSDAFRLSSAKATETEPITNGTIETSNLPQVRAASPFDEWNAAALPLTPGMKWANAKNASSVFEQGRRSMMDTPELEGGTIH